MLILALDTATPVTGVALLDEKTTRFEIIANQGFQHSRMLLQLVDIVLKQSSVTVNDLDAFAVTTGPGSFTGLRIGLATAKGLAMAAGKALVGVPTLDAMASAIGWTESLLCPLLNARKGEVYTAFYRGDETMPRRITEYMALKPEQLIEMSRDLITREETERILFVGDGVPQFGSELQAAMGSVFCSPPDPTMGYRPSNAGRLARERFKNGDVDDPLTLVPIYIRLSEAEMRLGRPV